MKSERLYLRATPETKEYLQSIADKYFEGKMSAVFDYMIERLELRLESVES
ncbi:MULTISPECIES: hypothetical protein [Bacillales]|uniref:hypothetical protein n=1 Tax=Bacillales TaxID=1385 RepID=UPI001586818F|nr:hypothetical protein [Bacillus sp. FJAT-27264]